ncbi:hypothetical protein X777_10011 [Ooceraea biroi]|uniref:Uncharacterized protein n=1 Tax=Ooceraea biroi TaxID=2015173 RepID=A0A026W6S2_OOCBI|nr:hypothetical protein X777_10011 [Ooceraea biroi]
MRGAKARGKKKQGMPYTKVLRRIAAREQESRRKSRREKGAQRSSSHRRRKKERERTSEKEKERKMRVHGYRYITGERVERGRRGTSVCVQKGEKEGHILYLWVFAATVLSRRRLAAEES